ncbi:MAG TPA: hypothetical protein VHX86_14515 [Tepidisphaeraceae bacterium]|jgi:hypothetical protein|nr:hypothetical protein [Tepidisphaeraceae bacterium]
MPITLQEVIALLQAFSALIAGLALVISSLALREVRKMKTIDLMRAFQERYDKLRWDIAKDVKGKQTAREFYSRFWNLQLEQYEYWQHGLIDDRIYTYWMQMRRTEWGETDPFLFSHKCPKPSYHDGWTIAAAVLKPHLHSFRTFQTCMDRILKTTQDIPTILRESKAARLWFIRLKRTVFGYRLAKDSAC